MFELNGTLIIFVVSFLIFMKLLNEIMLKPVGKIIEERANHIKADLDAAQLARDNAQKVINEYEAHLHTIRTEAQNLIEEAITKANHYRNQELSKLKDEGNQKLEAAKTEIAHEHKSILEDLIADESQIVNDIATKLLGEPVSLNLEPAQVRRALERVS